MPLPRLRVFIAVPFILTAACGGSDDTSSPATTQTPASQTGSGGAGSVTVVPHESLEALLPTLPGWTRGEPKSETDRTENVSRVTVNYDQPGTGAGISIELMDTSRNENMVAAARSAVTSPVPSPGTTVAATTLGGFPASEEWTAEAKNGVVNVLVADRFTVAVTGSSVADLATIRAVASAIDLQKLAALK
jgi:hypothetical protein